MNHQDACNHAQKLTNETGVNHAVVEVAEGFFIVEAVDAPPVDVRHDVEPKPPRNSHNKTPPVESGFTFSNGDELAAKAKAPNYLINNILETDAHGVLGGSSMAFKTFVAIRMAYSICTGKPFMGREVFYSGKVLMACGEGQGALSRRIKAIQIVEGDFNGCD